MRHTIFEFNDGLVISYLDEDLDYEKGIVTIYLEMPNKTKTDFNTCEFDYPANSFKNVVGFTNNELQSIRHRALKGSKILVEEGLVEYA